MGMLLSVAFCEERCGEMLTYEFTLLLSGLKEATDDVAKILYDSTCNDALFCQSNGVVQIDFARRGASFFDVVLSAIRDVESAGVGATVYKVEPNDFVTISDIVKRCNRSSESIRELRNGERGPGGFPAPAICGGRSPRWLWQQVAHWFEKSGLATPFLDNRNSNVAITEVLNALLTINRSTDLSFDQLVSEAFGHQ